jgi:hypothetical protein
MSIFSAIKSWLRPAPVYPVRRLSLDEAYATAIKDVPTFVTNANALLPTGALGDPRLVERDMAQPYLFWLAGIDGNYYKATAVVTFAGGKLHSPEIRVSVLGHSLDLADIDGWLPLKQEEVGQVFGKLKLLERAPEVPYIP